MVLLATQSRAHGQTSKAAPEIETTAVAILHCLHMAQSDKQPHLPWLYTADRFTQQEAERLGRRLKPDGFLPYDGLTHRTLFAATVKNWERIRQGRVRVGLHLLWDWGDVAHERQATIYLDRKPTGWVVDRKRSRFVGGE